MTNEDVLEASQIQANIIPGFNMPYQYLIACEITDPGILRTLLVPVLPMITTMDKAVPYHAERIRKAKAQNLFGKASFQLTEQQGLFWLNVAFGTSLTARFSATPAQLDLPFATGLAARSGLLGDPDDATSAGNVANWVAGGPGKEIDLLFIAASDNPAGLTTGVQHLKSILAQNNVSVLYEEKAERLDGDIEHFGFRDGISQPEPRGYSDKKNTFITPRTIVSGNEDPNSPEYAAPGKFLIWPGQFVFGYQKQSPDDFRKPIQADPLEKEPWVKNGSFLVFRRLRQDVAKFYKTVQDNFATINNNPSFREFTLEEFRSKFVGRHKDGSSLILENQLPDTAHPNNFYYHTDTPAFTLTDGTAVAPVKGDLQNSKCPMFAHVRKVNPRDLATDQRGPTDTATFRILRRGIPFGPPFNFQNAADPANSTERGLLFLAYQTSIQGQFELLTTKWMNNDSAPEAAIGFDMLVGQNGEAGQARARWCTCPNADGSATSRLVALSDHVIPTGGGYFFVPSINALRSIIKNDPKRT